MPYYIQLLDLHCDPHHPPSFERNLTCVISHCGCRSHLASVLATELSLVSQCHLLRRLLFFHLDLSFDAGSACMSRSWWLWSWAITALNSLHDVLLWSYLVCTWICYSSCHWIPSKRGSMFFNSDMSKICKSMTYFLPNSHPSGLLISCVPSITPWSVPWWQSLTLGCRATVRLLLWMV